MGDSLVNEPAESDAPTIVMYCRTWCGDCARARRWLDEREIPYVEVDVEADPSARERAASHNEGRLHTPTFEIGESVCVDFSPAQLCEILGIDE
jgi:mycoredoxin